MSNEVAMFNFEGAANVRVVIGENGEPLFVAKDVAVALGYARPNDAINEHCEGAAIYRPLQTAGGMQQIRVIDESDMYSLIFGSKLESAKRFKKWVTSEVLPSIRKTGRYGLVSMPDPMQILNDPAAMRGLLLNYSEQMIALQSDVQQKQTVIEEQQPKVEAFDRLSTIDDDGMCLTDAAKSIGVKRKDLTKFMSHNRWIYRRAGSKNWIAYQEKIQAGYLTHKIYTYQKDGEEKISESVVVTGKGMAKLAMLLDTKKPAE